MVELLLRFSSAGKVDSLLHAARGHDAEQSVEKRPAGDYSLVERFAERFVRWHVHFETLGNKKFSNELQLILEN